MIQSEVERFQVMVDGNAVSVHDRSDDKLYVRTVPIYEGYGYATFEEFCVRAGDGFRIGWATFDDFDVIYLYDARPEIDDGDGNAEGGNFGYAVNLQWPDGSEWGYAPFLPDGVDPEDAARSQAEMIAAFAGKSGDEETIRGLMHGTPVDGVTIIEPMPIRHASPGGRR